MSSFGQSATNLSRKAYQLPFERGSGPTLLLQRDHWYQTQADEAFSEWLELHYLYFLFSQQKPFDCHKLPRYGLSKPVINGHREYAIRPFWITTASTNSNQSAEMARKYQMQMVRYVSSLFPDPLCLMLPLLS